MKEKVVLVGNGKAGIRCLEEMLALGTDRFDLTVFGEEPHPNYNRIMLSKVLQGNTKSLSIGYIVLNANHANVGCFYAWQIGKSADKINGTQFFLFAAIKGQLLDFSHA